VKQIGKVLGVSRTSIYLSLAGGACRRSAGRGGDRVTDQRPSALARTDASPAPRRGLPTIKKAGAIPMIAVALVAGCTSAADHGPGSTPTSRPTAKAPAHPTAPTNAAPQPKPRHQPPGPYTDLARNESKTAHANVLSPTRCQSRPPRPGSSCSKRTHDRSAGTDRRLRICRCTRRA